MADTREKAPGLGAGENRLSHDSRRFETIFQHSPVPLWELDFSELRTAIESLRARGMNIPTYLEDHPRFLREAARMITVVDVNEAARVLSEVTDRRKLLGPLERALDLEDPAKLASLRDNVLLIAEGVTHREKEARMTTPSGRTLDILVTHFLTDPGDSSSRMMVSIQDISRQKRAESDLRRSEECYRTLAENLGEGIAIVDPTETFLYANPAAEEVFGVARGRLAGMELRQFVSETDYQHFFGEAGKRQGGEASRFEQRIVRPDGTTRWIEVIATPQFDQGGTFSHTLKIFRDITDVRKNQEALRRSEEWFRRLFQGHCAIMLIIDQPTGNILDANKAAAVFYGWSVEELTRMRIQQISIQAPEAMRRAPDEAALARPGTLELAHRRADGSVRDVEVFNSSIELTGRNVNYSIIYDITERKRAEKALVENEARFRTLIEQAPVAIMVSRNRTSLFANWKCLQLLGMRTVEESIGRPIASYFAPQAREEILERSRRRSLGQPAPDEFESVVCRADGSLCPIHVAVAQVVLSDGLAHIAFVTDITERTRAEAKLRESEERFRKLFEESPLGIAFLDTQREITLTNQRYRGFLGFSEAEICERGPAGIVHPEDWGPALSLSDRLRAGEIPLFHMELRYIRGDGSVVWADTHITALHDKDGRLTNTISWVQDITARKTAEAEKVKLEDQLRQAQKMESVGRLAGGVAHDFNNMLGVILGHAEMALEQVDPTQRLYDSLTEIRTAAEHSADLTRQLLSFARKQAISPRVLDLNRAVGGTVKMLQRMIGEDITITWQPEPDVWPVVMDPSQIDQILANLCVNARDAIAGVGRIAIRTRHTTLESGFCAAHPGAVAGEYVQLDVSDNGCGMDEMTLSHIFEPFFTTKGAGKGTGLGLATVFGIVKQNNGFINVESEAGRGTTFSIYLPRCLGEAAQGQGQDAARSTPRGQGTILVVEDDPAILKLVTMMLKQLGYKVLAANTIKEATRLAEENTAEIGLLLTDVIMPESNGRELTKRLRTVCPHIKVLFMSGYAADIIAHQGVLEEGECFIQKPFSAKALANKIQETFAR